MILVLFALVVLKNDFVSIPEYCDPIAAGCYRGVLWCTSVLELKAAMVGPFSCSCLLPVMQEGLISILKVPVKENIFKRP